MKLSALDDLSIRPLMPTDLEDVAALQPEGWGDILPSIRFYTTSQFCHPLKANLNGKTVGIGTAIMHKNTAWLGHIIVHKDFRNAGIGGSITASLIEIVRGLGYETMFLIATALGERVYSKLGFTTEARYVFLDFGDLPEPSGESNVEPFQPKYKDDLLDFDLHTSGENRERLLTEHLNDAKLFLQDNKIIGCYLPTLGEGLILASNSAVGVELMKHKYRHNKNFCIPTENVAGISFLEQHGYKKVREASRMILGKKINWDPSKIYSRIGGNLG